ASKREWRKQAAAFSSAACLRGSLHARTSRRDAIGNARLCDVLRHVACFRIPARRGCAPTGTDWNKKRRGGPMGAILLLILLLLLIGGLPAWPYSRRWGYSPSGLFTLLIVVVLVLVLLGPVPLWFGPPAPVSPVVP